ncbi:MAG: hypothetical protein WD396_06150, partial [Pseudohongiellaceae bacterium]
MKALYCSVVSTLLLLAGSATLAADNGWLRGSCASGTGTYRWTDGTRYEGQCRNNYFEGQGTLTMPN